MLYLLFAFSLVVLSQAGPLIRLCETDAMTIVFWRMLIACAIMAPIVGFKLKKTKTKLNFNPRDFGTWLAAGLFMFVHFYSFFLSVQETTVGNATILFCLNPIFTCLGAFIFLKERPHLFHYLSILLGISGIVALFMDTTAIQGNFWGLLCAVTFSAYLILSKKLRAKMPNLLFAFGVYLQITIFAGLAMLLMHLDFSNYSDKTWLGFALLAVFPTLLGHAIVTYCLQFLNINFVSCATMVEPPIAILSAALFFNEVLTLSSWIGVILSTMAVLLLHYPYLKARLSLAN